MDELIRQVTERTGLSDDKARAAVDTVLGFLKQRLPAPIAGQLDSVIGTGAGAAGDIVSKAGGLAGDVLGGLGGMLGGPKE